MWQVTVSGNMIKQLTAFVNTLSANPTKWSNTLKQFVGNLPTNCLSVSDHFVKLALKVFKFSYYYWDTATAVRISLRKVLIFNMAAKRWFKGTKSRTSHPEVFLGKGTLKICCEFTAEHLYLSVISIKLLCNFIEIALRHGCYLINLLHILRTPFYKNSKDGSLLKKILV